MSITYHEEMLPLPNEVLAYLVGVLIDLIRVVCDVSLAAPIGAYDFEYWYESFFGLYYILN
jgi:hypothetical protein